MKCPWLVGPVALLVACLLLAAGAAPALGAGAREPVPRAGPFAWLVPAPAPLEWSRSVIPALAGQASVAYPPSFTRINGDAGTVSFAVRTSTGAVRAYLNVTPRQGNERLRGFAAFRVHLLGRDDDQTVHEEAAAEGLMFQGGRGSCVVDNYVTKVGHHRYREIACLVMGQRGAAVVVASATAADWSHFEPQLRRAVASFTIS